MSFKYSDYCTAYYVPEDKAVCVYDEIQDREIQRIPVDDECHAEKVMNDWVDRAPNGSIVEKI